MIRPATRSLSILVSAFLLGPCALAQESTKQPATVEIPGDRLELALGDPLSARALVTKPLPITAVMGWTLESRRHRGAIWCHALSPDGRTLATGGLDGTIRLWDVETGNLVRALVGHNSYVSSLDWSPDGNTLASAGTYDITARLWDTRTGRPLRVLRGHPAEVTLVRWSPDGRFVLASGGQSGHVSCWFAVSGTMRSKLELGQAIANMSWHPDAKSAALVSSNLPIQIWEAEKGGKVNRTIGNAKDGFLCAAWAPDGKQLAVGTAKETQVLDGAAGKVMHTLPSAAYALAWIQKGKELATMMPDSVKIWDADAGKLEGTISVSGAQLLAATRDSATLITSTYTSFAVHDRATLKTLRRFDNLSGTEPPLWFAGKTLVTGIGSVKLSQWDADTGKRLRFLEGHTGAISAVAVAPGGKTLATASHDKTVKLWDAANGSLLHTFTDHSAAVLAVAFAFDGKTIASADADKKILVWDAASAKAKHTLTGSTSNVTALAWKPASNSVLLSNGKESTAQVWNVRTGKSEANLKGVYELISLAWSPDGERVAGGQGNGDVLIWHEASGKLLHTLKEPGSPPHVASLAFSPKAQALASGRGNHTMQLWEPKGGKKLFSMQTMAPATRVSWTASGGTVGVSSQDRTARFFDPATGHLRALILAEEEQLIAINFDGHYRAPAAESELVYVVQKQTSQETYTPTQFAAKFKLKNSPAKVNPFGK